MEHRESDSINVHGIEALGNTYFYTRIFSLLSNKAHFFGVLEGIAAKLGRELHISLKNLLDRGSVPLTISYSKAYRLVFLSEQKGRQMFR
jgi:hypothetical protein